MQLRAKYAVVCNGISDVNHAFMGRAIFLNLWHGVPLKKVGYDDDKVKTGDSRGQKIRRLISRFLWEESMWQLQVRIISQLMRVHFASSDHILVVGSPEMTFFFDREGKFRFSTD